MQNCKVDGCTTPVSKPEHTLCLEHWKAEKEERLFRCTDCGRLMDKDLPLCSECYRTKGKGAKGQAAFKDKTLSSTALGEAFGLTPMKVNQILAELGWITKYTKGWIPTPAGNGHGAEAREWKESGVPYVVWPQEILQDKILDRSVREFKGEVIQDEAPETTADTGVASGFRQKFPGTYRAQDGHMVRSKAEVLIDNFLYTSGIVHAFERKLPISEEVYCDFYLLKKKVYIEYWGLENDPKYKARKQEKIQIYHKYKLSLIELRDEHVQNLDDHLPKMLLKYGINTED